MVREIVLSPHNSTWATVFAQEAAWLELLLEPEIIASHHIGSTAIPGIHAKPTVDILLAVHDITALGGYAGVMRAAGYVVRGEAGIPGSRYFCKGRDEHHTYHVHAFQQGNPQIRRHVLFCSYMRAHPEEARAYEILKLSLLAAYRYDSKAYTNGKSEFIRERDRCACLWGADQIVQGADLPPATNDEEERCSS